MSSSTLKFRADVKTTPHTEKMTLVEMPRGGEMDNLPPANNRAVVEREDEEVEDEGKEEGMEKTEKAMSTGNGRNMHKEESRLIRRRKM